ncbi:MAG: TlpA family protein disulfide reductase [Cetobacterium sp.]
MAKYFTLYFLILSSLMAREIENEVDLYKFKRLKSGGVYQDYLQNKVVDLKFVTTWCRFCREEMSSVQKNDEKKYIHVFGTYGGDNEEKVIGVLEEFSNLEDVIFDEGNILFKKFEIKKVPTVVKIRKSSFKNPKKDENKK